MEESLEQAFKTAVYNCEECYKFFKNNPNIENLYLVHAQSALKKIMESYNQEDINWQRAHAAMDKCNACGFRDSKIKDFVETFGIKVS